MGQRSKRRERCELCRVHIEHCLCEGMPRLDLQTRVALVMHCRETRKTTSTGPLALSTLSNSELFIHGAQDKPLDLTHLHEAGRRVLVLYPSENAVPLDQLDRSSDTRPVTLVVPDGNWRQASRVPRRVPGLQNAEAVTLPQGPKTRWGVRRETKDGGLATFEAIARALGFLESVEVQEQLESFFLRTVKTFFEVRGYGPLGAPLSGPLGLASETDGEVADPSRHEGEPCQ